MLFFDCCIKIANININININIMLILIMCIADDFPYGTKFGDSVLRGDDVVAEVSVPARVGFGVLGTDISKLYVSTSWNDMPLSLLLSITY